MATSLSVPAVLSRTARTASAQRLLTRPAVITLGGLHASTHQFLPIHLSLWRSGLYKVFPIHYDGFNHSIDENGAALAKLVEQRLSSDKNARSQLHFVTHSYGALVLRSAMRQLGWSGEGSRIVMIAPCNRGSVLARRLAGYNCASVLLGSLAGSELGENGEGYFDEIGDMPKLAKVRVIAGTGGFWNPLLPSGSRHDGRVLLPETRLRTPHDLVTVGATHGFMLYHPRVIKATRRFIQGSAKGLRAWECRRGDEPPFHVDSRSGSRRWKGVAGDGDDEDEGEDGSGGVPTVADVAEAVRVGVGAGGEELRVGAEDRERADRLRRRNARLREQRDRRRDRMVKDGGKGWFRARGVEQAVLPGGPDSTVSQSAAAWAGGLGEASMVVPRRMELTAARVSVDSDLIEGCRGSGIPGQSAGAGSCCDSEGDWPQEQHRVHAEGQQQGVHAGGTLHLMDAEPAVDQVQQTVIGLANRWHFDRTPSVVTLYRAALGRTDGYWSQSSGSASMVHGLSVDGDVS